MKDREQDLDWLRSLKDRFWEERRDPKTGKWMAEKYERLTDDELTRLHEVILRWDLPVRMINTRFGFGVGIVIHEPEKPAIYPGVEEATIPDPIVCISQSHLPLSQSTFDAKDRITFEDGWRVFSELTHRDQNLAVLARCNLPKPESKGAYVY